jgi:hypothetical protein
MNFPEAFLIATQEPPLSSFTVCPETLVPLVSCRAFQHGHPASPGPAPWFTLHLSSHHCNLHVTTTAVLIGSLRVLKESRILLSLHCEQDRCIKQYPDDVKRQWRSRSHPDCPNSPRKSSTTTFSPSKSHATRHPPIALNTAGSGAVPVPHWY